MWLRVLFVEPTSERTLARIWNADENRCFGERVQARGMG